MAPKTMIKTPPKTTKAKADEQATVRREKKTTGELRSVLVRFRGQDYLGLARGSEFVGLLCRAPRGTGLSEWSEAVAQACR